MLFAPYYEIREFYATVAGEDSEMDARRREIRRHAHDTAQKAKQAAIAAGLSREQARQVYAQARAALFEKEETLFRSADDTSLNIDPKHHSDTPELDFESTCPPLKNDAGSEAAEVAQATEKAPAAAPTPAKISSAKAAADTHLREVFSQLTIGIQKEQENEKLTLASHEATPSTTSMHDHEAVDEARGGAGHHDDEAAAKSVNFVARSSADQVSESDEVLTELSEDSEAHTELSDLTERSSVEDEDEDYDPLVIFYV